MPDYSFTYPTFSEGEIISSEKLNNIPTYLRETLLKYIFEKHRSGKIKSYRSGVLNGFEVIPAVPSQMTVKIMPGVGIALRPNNTIHPVIIKNPIDVRLYDPDPTDYFWQVIVLKPYQYYDQYTQRVLRKPDGTIDVQNLPGVVVDTYDYVVNRGDLAPSNPPVPNGLSKQIVVAAVLTRPSTQPYVINPSDIYDVRTFLADTEGTTLDYFCVGQWSGNPIQFERLIEATNSQNLRIKQSLQPIEDLTGHYLAQFTIPKALGAHSRELIKTTVDYPGVAFATIEFTDSYYPLDAEARVQLIQSTENLPYWLVNLLIRIRDRYSGEFADIQSHHAYLQIRASLPRYD
jgi:hypothetical protein